MHSLQVFAPMPRFNPCQFAEFEISVLPFPQVGHFSFDLSELLFRQTPWEKLEFLEDVSWAYKKRSEPHFFFELKSDDNSHWKIALSSNGSFIAHNDKKNPIPVPLFLKRHGSPCSSFVRTTSHDTHMARALDTIADFFQDKPTPLSMKEAIQKGHDHSSWISWWDPFPNQKPSKKGNMSIEEYVGACAVIAQAQSNVHIGDIHLTVSGHPVDDKGRIILPDISIQASNKTGLKEYKDAMRQAMALDVDFVKRLVSSSISGTTTPEKTYEPGIIQGPSRFFMYHDFGVFSQHKRMSILSAYKEKRLQDIINMMKKDTTP